MYIRFIEGYCKLLKLMKLKVGLWLHTTSGFILFIGTQSVLVRLCNPQPFHWMILFQNGETHIYIPSSLPSFQDLVSLPLTICGSKLNSPLILAALLGIMKSHYKTWHSAAALMLSSACFICSFSMRRALVKCTVSLHRLRRPVACLLRSFVRPQCLMPRRNLWKKTCTCNYYLNVNLCHILNSCRGTVLSTSRELAVFP